MKLLFSCIITVFISYPAHTQGAFYLKENTKKNFEILAISENNNGFLMVGNSSSSSSNSAGYLAFIDLEGKTIWEKFILDTINEEAEQYTTVLFHDNYFYVGGILTNNGKYYNLLLKISPDGNIIYKKTVGGQSTLGFDNHFKEMLTNENGILLATSGLHNGRTQGELVQVDFDGNILWDNHFFSYVNADNSFWEYFEAIEKDKEGNFIALLSSNANSISHSYKTIIKTNSYGVELWRKTLDTLTPSSLSSDTLSLLSIAPFKKTHLLALFNVVSSLQENFQADFVLIEYDKEGNELNYKRFYNPNGFGSSKLSTDDDDNLYISGTKHFNDSLRLSLIKLSAEKEVEWEHTYFKKRASIVDSQWINSGETFINGNPTSDNGFILTGNDLYMIDNDFYWNSSIIKTDCQGNTTWNFNTCFSPEFQTISIFPNPTSDHFILQIPNISAQDEVKVLIFDLQGKKILERKYINSPVISINAHEWNNGIYMLKIDIGNMQENIFKLIKSN